MHLFRLHYSNLFLYDFTYSNYSDDYDIKIAFSDYFINFPNLNIIIKHFFHILSVIIIAIIKFCRCLNHIHFIIPEDYQIINFDNNLLYCFICFVWQKFYVLKLTLFINYYFKEYFQKLLHFN
jgi:hypothetical protein